MGKPGGRLIVSLNWTVRPRSVCLVLSLEHIQSIFTNWNHRVEVGSTDVARREFAYTAGNPVSKTRGPHAEIKHHLTFADREMKCHENKILRHGKKLLSSL